MAGLDAGDERAEFATAEDQLGTVRVLGVPDGVDAGKIVATELVSNAVEHSAEEQEITLRTFLGDDGLPVVEVWDDVDEGPVLRNPGEDDESGRGLLLVDALSAQWGTNHVVDGGKVVWAVLA